MVSFFYFFQQKESEAQTPDVKPDEIDCKQKCMQNGPNCLCLKLKWY